MLIATRALHHPPPSQGPETVLTPLPGNPAGARAVAAVVNGDRLRMDVSGLAASTDDAFYELWLLNSPNDLVGLASFKVPASGKTTLTVPLPADVGSFQFLDISGEPADGKPSRSSDSARRGNTTRPDPPAAPISWWCDLLS